MTNSLAEDKVAKTYEAHSKKMTIAEAANYAKVSRCAVLANWRKAGLKPHFPPGGRPISGEQEAKIYEANKQGLSQVKAAKYAEVCPRTASKYCKKAGLAQHYKPNRFRPSLRYLLDVVFDTVNNPGECLCVEEIKNRLETRLSTKLDEGVLRKKIKFLVKTGFYEPVEREDGSISYKAGMPKAMDGCLEKEIDE